MRQRGALGDVACACGAQRIRGRSPARHRRLQALAWSALVMSLYGTACSKSADHEQSDQDAEPPESAEFVGCPDSTPQFELGMTVTSADGAIHAKLLEAKPAPPARFFNDWTVAFSAADQAPLDDVNLQSARAFMPVHGHYGKPDPRVTARDAESAVVDIDALNLFMRGPWEIMLTVSSASAGDAELVFHVCVEE